MGSLLCAQESSPVSPAFYGPNAFPVPEIELEWSASDLSFETGPQLASLKGFSLQDDVTYIPASIHNEAMLSGAWTSIAQ